MDGLGIFDVEGYADSIRPLLMKVIFLIPWSFCVPGGYGWIVCGMPLFTPKNLPGPEDWLDVCF